MGWIANQYGAREVVEPSGWTGVWLHHADSITRVRRNGQTVYATKEEAEKAITSLREEDRLISS
jgi:hypothetical protein